ncbi:MAG: hypothetical protein V2J89_05690 [Halieaceae bacterium]|jgi:hypothetical protein|nr:hypothetical protein [Halieaceae bacterium]
MRYITLIVLLCVAPLVSAASFQEVVVRGGNYMIIATGEIQDSDRDRLRNIFVRRKAFPVITRLKTTGGSPEAAMALGQLYRDASIAVLADEGCDTACFLWLVGGTSRAVNNDVTLTGKVMQQRAVKRYLEDMDIEKETQSPWQQTQTVLTAAGFAEQVGERPAAVERWMNESCGKLSEEDNENFRALQAASFLEALQRLAEKREDDSELQPIIARQEALAARAETLSNEEKLALQERWFKLRACKESYIAERQQAFMEQLKRELAEEKAAKAAQATSAPAR